MCCACIKLRALYVGCFKHLPGLYRSVSCGRCRKYCLCFIERPSFHANQVRTTAPLRPWIYVMCFMTLVLSSAELHWEQTTLRPPLGRPAGNRFQGR